jgi:hypothetical protein
VNGRVIHRLFAPGANNLRADELDWLLAQLDHDAGVDQVRGFARQVFVDALLERAIADALAEIRAGRPDVAVEVLDRALARADRITRSRNGSDTNPQVKA